MNSKEKFWFLVGPVAMAFVFAFTTPVIHVYFVSLISSRILAIANLLSVSLAAFVNWSITLQTMKEWYRRHFLWIVTIDVLLFSCVSFAGYEYPAVRFLGFAFINAVSTCLWVMVMRNAVNHIIKEGDARTDFDAFNQSTCLTASLVGGIMAIIVELPVEICILLQCLVNMFMGITDLYAFKILSKKYLTS